MFENKGIDIDIDNVRVCISCTYAYICMCKYMCL